MTTKIEQNFEKRKSISKEIAFEMLKDCIGDMFMAYFNAVDKFNVEINQTIPEARTRLNAALLNAKLTESFILKFPEHWTKGKYGRIIFRWNEVQILIKKLNEDSKPCYIPTLLSDCITNQYQSELFKGDEAAKAEPILMFGYTKDRFGQLINPRVVYFDNTVKWTLTKDEISTQPISNDKVEDIEILIKKDREQKAE